MLKFRMLLLVVAVLVVSVAALLYQFLRYAFSPSSNYSSSSAAAVHALVSVIRPGYAFLLVNFIVIVLLKFPSTLSGKSQEQEIHSRCQIQYFQINQETIHTHRVVAANLPVLDEKRELEVHEEEEEADFSYPAMSFGTKQEPKVQEVQDSSCSVISFGMKQEEEQINEEEHDSCYFVPPYGRKQEKKGNTEEKPDSCYSASCNMEEERIIELDCIKHEVEHENDSLESIWAKISEINTSEINTSNHNSEQKNLQLPPIIPPSTKRRAEKNMRNIKRPAPLPPATSEDDLRNKVEAFISKFNADIQLEKQQSYYRYIDMLNRAAF